MARALVGYCNHRFFWLQRTETVFLSLTKKGTLLERKVAPHGRIKTGELGLGPRLVSAVRVSQEALLSAQFVSVWLLCFFADLNYTHHLAQDDSKSLSSPQRESDCSELIWSSLTTQITGCCSACEMGPCGKQQICCG